MTITIIAIPHQKPAKSWTYQDESDLIAQARNEAAETDRPEPTDRQEAIDTLTSDLHGYLLVETAADLVDVLIYARGGRHQSHKVAALVAEIREQLDIYPTADDKRTLGRLSTRDDAGVHFTSLHSSDWLRDMEMLGWIDIYRPVGGSRVPYCQDNWSVEVDAEVADWFDTNGDLME